MAMARGFRIAHGSLLWEVGCASAGTICHWLNRDVCLPRNERHGQRTVNQVPPVSLTKSLSRNMYLPSGDRHAHRNGQKCYRTAWMKSREPFDGPFAQKVRATETDQQKMLMGAIEKW